MIFNHRFIVLGKGVGLDLLSSIFDWNRSSKVCQKIACDVDEVIEFV